MKAARAGNLDIVQALLAAKADPNLTDYAGATAIRYAEESRQKRVADALRAAGGS